MKILCVDDDRTTLTLITRSLERICPEDEILSASCGEDAIQMLEHNKVELLITDLVMPGASGMDVLEKSKAVRPETEVIMVTAYSSVESAVEAMQKGARDYLPKPINLDLLIEKVENLKEFLLSRREVNDYRYAMTIIEDDVYRTAEASDRKLSEHRSALAKIESIVDGALSPEGKLEQIGETLGLLASSDAQ